MDTNTIQEQEQIKQLKQAIDSQLAAKDATIAQQKALIAADCVYMKKQAETIAEQENCIADQASIISDQIKAKGKLEETRLEFSQSEVKVEREQRELIQVHVNALEAQLRASAEPAVPETPLTSCKFTIYEDPVETEAAPSSVPAPVSRTMTRINYTSPFAPIAEVSEHECDIEATAPSVTEDAPTPIVKLDRISKPPSLPKPTTAAPVNPKRNSKRRFSPLYSLGVC